MGKYAQTWRTKILKWSFPLELRIFSDIFCSLLHAGMENISYNKWIQSLYFTCIVLYASFKLGSTEFIEQKVFFEDAWVQYASIER